MSPPDRFLRLDTVRDAVVVARPVLDDWSGGAGVLRRVGDELRVVKGSGIRRRGRQQIIPPATTGWSVTRQLPAGVYAGFLYDHYGHFLLESLARLWTPAPAPAVPVIWIAAWTEELTPWMVEILDLLGVADERVIVTSAGALEVGELLVPSPGFEFGSFMHRWLATRLGVVAPAVDAGNHVWLSRSVRAPISGLDEEEELEGRLRAYGWRIVHPEHLTVSEQVDELTQAVHVAGLEGSAFHTLALLRGYRGAVDLFTRQEHVNFEHVAAATGLDQRRHRIPGATPRERKKVRGVDVQWAGADLDGVVEVLCATCRRHGHAPPRERA